MTLPSIFLETQEKYSWLIPGLSVFCSWLFLVFSGVFLETAATFLPFLNFAMILREKFCQLWRLSFVFYFNKGEISPLIMREKFQREQTVNDFINKYHTRNCKFIQSGNNCAFVSPLYIFSSAGNVIVYTLIQGKIGEKFFWRHYL